MKKFLLPFSLFIVGLIVAQVFFGINIKEMFEGSCEFVVRILKGADG